MVNLGKKGNWLFSLDNGQVHLRWPAVPQARAAALRVSFHIPRIQHDHPQNVATTDTPTSANSCCMVRFWKTTIYAKVNLHKIPLKIHNRRFEFK